MAYVYFTDEQKHKANTVDLVDFLQRQGEQLVRSGREWRWKRYDSVTVRGNEWFRHSRKEGGCAIDFVQQFYDMSFPEAVCFLLGGESGVEWNQTEKSAPPPRKAFALPEENYDMRRVFAYLIKQRFIDREIISFFAHEKLIYEDSQYHNAVFVGLDENSIPRHAHKRGTYTKGDSYKGNVEGSDPKFSFHWSGNSDRIYVFEAPVDMLSFITLYPRDWQEHSYVALDGVSEHALLQQLRQNTELRKVFLCLDHDAAGIEANARLKDILSENDYIDVTVIQSINKDWNEDLKAKNGMPPIPSEEHPKIILFPQVCEKLLVLCEKISLSRNIRYLLKDTYQALESMVSTGKIMPENEESVRECIEYMAACSLLLTKELCRQMEHPVTMDELMKKLQTSYSVHKDRGWLRTRLEDIRNSMTEIDQMIDNSGIRTEADQKKLGGLYLRLALNCIRTEMFIELEFQAVQQKQEKEANMRLSM